MYKYEKKVLFSDVDAYSNMTLEGILDSMQDCVNINSESIGRGIEYMHKTKRGWFAVSWNIEIRRYPKMFEDIVVKTWPYDFSSTLGFRNVIITDSDGNDIVCADSIWSLVDLDSGMPIKIEEEDSKGYEIEDRYPMDKLGRKIRLPQAMVEGEDNLGVTYHTVTKTDIDFNGHMTNGCYIKYADNLVPVGTVIRRIRVEYKAQSRLGEQLKILSFFDESENRYIIRLEGKEDGKVRAIVEFKI